MALENSQRYNPVTGKATSPRNLRSLLDYRRVCKIASINLWRLYEGGGRLTVAFYNGVVYVYPFASFDIAEGFINRFLKKYIICEDRIYIDRTAYTAS